MEGGRAIAGSHGGAGVASGGEFPFEAIDERAGGGDPGAANSLGDVFFFVAGQIRL
ncbi:hypothetical protein D3C72_2593680 [compost metagenome]